MGRLFPKRRDRMVRRHVHAMRDATLWIMSRVGGARFDIEPRFPSQGGVLIIMNHQSLIDIPVGFKMLPDGYPRCVTHHRYAKGVPLVSQLIRMMGPILVYPGQTGKGEFERLAATARTANHTIILFPEGHRTRDGEIRPWKRGALDAFLSARAWTVHLVVVDGLWQTARIPDFIRNVSRVRCRVELAETLEYDGRGLDSHEEFTERARSRMCAKLAEMRSASRGENVAPEPPRPMPTTSR